MKTFVVDDHYMVIEGIRSLLQNERDIETTEEKGALKEKELLGFRPMAQPPPLPIPKRKDWMSLRG